MMKQFAITLVAGLFVNPVEADDPLVINVWPGKAVVKTRVSHVHRGSILIHKP